MTGSCLNCKFAEWRRTVTGRLHPSGAGKCLHVWTPPPYSAAFYFYGHSKIPHPAGGLIDRSQPHSATKCPVYEPRLKDNAP